MALIWRAVFGACCVFLPSRILISCVPEPFPGTELHLLVFLASDALLRAFSGERVSVGEIKTLTCSEPIRQHNNTELQGVKKLSWQRTD